MGRTVVILILVACAILGLVFVPWMAFWAIGVLFGHHIDVTFRTWLAAWVLLVLVSGPSASGRST